MTLRFPYVPRAIIGPVPPTLPLHTIARWRPLVPVRIANPVMGRWRRFGRAVLDSGAGDTVFPLAHAQALGIVLLPRSGRGHTIHWHGTAYQTEFGEIELELDDGTGRCR